jgi:hypothetical protein
VQYGQPQCYYCGYQMYWQAPPSSFTTKMKSVFQILSQKTPPVQYPIAVPPPPYRQSSPQDQTPVQNPSFTQPTAPDQPPAVIQLPGPGQPPTIAQPPPPVQRPSAIEPDAPVQRPSPILQPAPEKPPSFAEASAPVQPTSYPQSTGPAPEDKLKSIIGVPFETPRTGRRQQQETPPQELTPEQEIAGDASGGRLKLKDTSTAYLYWLCLGLHYRYLENMSTQLIFWFTLGGLGLWWLFDLVRIPTMVRDYNINQRLNVVLKAEALNKPAPPKEIKMHERNYQIKDKDTDKFKRPNQNI